MPFQLRASDAVLGDPRLAAIHLVVYLDYAAPVSRSVAAIVDRARASWGGQLACAFRPVPRGAGVLVAVGLEAARRQGRFEALHRILLERPVVDGEERALVDAARGAGLDLRRFLLDIGDRALTRRVLDDARTLAHHGLAPPALFVNGRRIGFDRLAESLEEAMLATPTPTA